MKMIKAKAGYPKCTFCEAKAKYKASGCHSHLAPKVCEEHKNNLKIWEEQTRDDGHMTEADHQTWGRLK